MARTPDVNTALRSYFPEELLLETGDQQGLAMKYEARAGTGLSRRVMALTALDGTFWGGKPKEDGEKVFDQVSIDVGVPAPFSGYDSENHVGIELGSTDALLLHIQTPEGLQHLYSQLADVAEYIAHEPAAENASYVAGVTYREMADLGKKLLGMRELEIESIDPKFCARIRAAHVVTFAGYREPRAFEPAVVYMSKAEFIQRFSSAGE